jgi:Protein of unknown function (DUF2924)
MKNNSLNALSTQDLQARFERAFGKSTTSRNRPWLIKRLAAAPTAASTPNTRQPARPISVHSSTTIIPPIGSEVRKMWRGQELVVQVQADGYLLHGTLYRSLSAAATALCGGNRNGLVFFGLKPRPVHAQAAS